jgi:hypothetical protein
MGPHWLEHREGEEGARAPLSPSLSTSWVVLEADSDGGRVRERGRRVAVARVLDPPPKSPKRSHMGVGHY